MNEQKQIPPERSLKISQGILYGIGCGIGGSIFILLSSAIQVAGTGVLISLILGGILIFFTALNYSELSTSFPISGGSYSLGKEAMGGFSAFITGIFLWIANVATVTFSALALGTIIFEVFFSFFQSFIIIIIPIAIASILFTTIFIFRTQKMAVKTLIRLTILLLAIFLFFIIAGLFIAPFTNTTNFNPSIFSSQISFFGTIQTFAVLFICFTSITANIAYLSTNLKNPSKSIPRIHKYAIIFTLVIYLAIAFVVLLNIGIDHSGLAQTHVLLAHILDNVLGPVGFYLMAFAAIISTLIAMNAALGSAVSLFHALARDNYVPKKFKKVSKKTGVPLYCLILTVILAIIFSIFLQINVIAEIMSFIYFFGLSAVNFAAVRLRYKRKELDRPYKAPFFPYLPIIVGAFCLIFAFVLSTSAIVAGVIVSIICLSIYLIIFADRTSIFLTLAGLKFFSIITIGIVIWIINNLGVLTTIIPGLETTFTYVLMRILIAIGIFAIFSVVLDVIPLKEFVYFFTKKIDKDKVAINIGGASIISLNKNAQKVLHGINVIIGIVQLLSSVFIFAIIIPLISLNVISISTITIGSVIILQDTSEYIFLSSLIIFGTLLFLSGLVFTYYTSMEGSSL